MSATQPTFDVNAKVPAAYGIAGDLGNVYETVDGKLYRLCKAAAAITANAGGLLVKTARSAGVPTWAVSKVTTAADANTVGVIPSGISTLAASDYFFVQIEGNSSVQSNTTAITNGALLAPSTDGQANAYTTISLGLLKVIGRATNTSAATAAGALITCDLRKIL